MILYKKNLLRQLLIMECEIEKLIPGFYSHSVLGVVVLLCGFLLLFDFSTVVTS